MKLIHCFIFTLPQHVELPFFLPIVAIELLFPFFPRHLWHANTKAGMRCAR